MAAHVEDSKEHLEKELSPLNVCALAFGCIIGWGAFVMPGNTFLPRSGPLGTALGMLVASGIMIVIACNYHFMIKRFPVAGGGFIYAKHAFGDRHAFFCGWFLVLSYAALVPMNATALALIVRNLWGDVFRQGIEYRMMGNPIYLWEVLIAVIAILFFGVLCIVGVKQVGSFQILLTAALIIGVALVCIPAVFSPVSVFPEPLLRPGQSSFSAVVAILAVAPWAFVGFDTVPQSAEEYKFSPNKTRVIMVVSILFGAFVYVALNTLTASVIPQRFSNWYEYIQQVPSLSGIEALPTFNAAYRLLGRFGLVVLSAAVFGAILSGLLGFFMASSRLVYSMAVSNILPECFGRIDSKRHTPRNAIVFLLCFALIAPFFGRTVLGWLVDMSSLGAAIGYAYTSAAALKYAVRDRNRWICFTGVLGIIFAVLFMVILLVPIPSLECSLGRESYICLAIWVVLGLLFYLYSVRSRH